MLWPAEELHAPRGIAGRLLGWIVDDAEEEHSATQFVDDGESAGSIFDIDRVCKICYARELREI